MVLAYLLVVVFDLAVSRTGAWPGKGAVSRRRDRPDETSVAPPPPTELEPRHVHVVPRDSDPADQPVLAPGARPDPRAGARAGACDPSRSPGAERR